MAYDEDEVRFLGLASEQIGLAIDAAVNLYISQRVQDRLKLILDLSNQVFRICIFTICSWLRLRVSAVSCIATLRLLC